MYGQISKLSPVLAVVDLLLDLHLDRTRCTNWKRNKNPYLDDDVAVITVWVRVHSPNTDTIDESTLSYGEFGESLLALHQCVSHLLRNGEFGESLLALHQCVSHLLRNGEFGESLLALHQCVSHLKVFLKIYSVERQHSTLWKPLVQTEGEKKRQLSHSANGKRVHYVIVSKNQWKPFWLATQLTESLGWVAILCGLRRKPMCTGPILKSSKSKYFFFTQTYAR